MMLHDVNAPVPEAAGGPLQCAICESNTEPSEGVLVQRKIVCNRCVGDVLAQLAADFRRSLHEP